MKTRRVFSLWQKRRVEPMQQKGALAAYQNRECFLTMDIFRDLEPEALAAFEQQTEMRMCRKGQILYSQEDQAEVVTITHQELGDMIGALRESVTKVLDEFQRAGLVELSRGASSCVM